MSGRGIVPHPRDSRRGDLRSPAAFSASETFLTDNGGRTVSHPDGTRYPAHTTERFGVDEVYLQATAAAFNAVAAAYDGPSGNNTAVQYLRRQLWRAVEERVPPGSRLLDLGCGTGIDAVYFAARGYSVVAIDQSTGMVEHAIRRAHAAVNGRVEVRHLGIQDLNFLVGERFDAIYSDLGALNCVPDLETLADTCAELLMPGGRFLASVIGRFCPWEVAYFALRGNRQRATIRLRPHPVPVPLDGRTVWTWYHTPRRFYRPFASHFALDRYRGLLVLLPPPYLGPERRWLRRGPLAGLDRYAGMVPGLRATGDHFLMEMVRR